MTASTTGDARALLRERGVLGIFVVSPTGTDTLSGFYLSVGWVVGGNLLPVGVVLATSLFTLGLRAAIGAAAVPLAGLSPFEFNRVGSRIALLS